MVEKNEASQLDCFKTAEQCAANLDAALDDMVFHENGSYKSRTCFSCDCLLLYIEEFPNIFGIERLKGLAHLFRLTKKTVQMSDYRIATIPQDVIDYYKYHVEGHNWLEECVISPNSCYSKRRKGFLICKKCYDSLRKKRYPQLGIKNGYMIGTAPDIVQLLSYEELSCISLVRNTAHVFTYMGGEDTTIKGWHSMLEVDLSQVQRTLCGMEHDNLGFPDSIVVILEGCMTRAQYKKLKNKANASRANML